MDRIGRVLIVNNQVYHKPHAGSLDCKECEKTTRPQDIASEDKEVNELLEKFIELGFTDIDGGTNKFVYKDQTKAQMIALLEKGKDRKKVHIITIAVLIYVFTIILSCSSNFKDISMFFLVAKQNFSLEYCFICVILSYGKDGVITCVPMKENDSVKNPTDRMLLPLAELQDCLKGEKCKGLLAKPKIFMLQVSA